MIEDYKSISYFRGLNSLRFFAAFLVVLQHAESIRHDKGLPSLIHLGIFNNGAEAVSFFFVLSGFLITYLLLKERKDTNETSIKRFYIKRVFRIWPLYFLLVFIGIVLQPIFIKAFNLPFELPYTAGETWYYFVFFIPGLVNHFFSNHMLEPLWSIGVEEVFYLIWAPLFKWIKKHVLALLLSVIAIKYLLILYAQFYTFSSNPAVNDVFKYVIRIHQFESMALGGLGAYLTFHFGNRVATAKIFNVFPQIIIYGLLLTLLFFSSTIHQPVWVFIHKSPILYSLLTNFLFLYLILGTAIAEKNLFRLEFGWLKYLGEISYGIYMFHVLILGFPIEALKGYLSTCSLTWATVIYYGISLPIIFGICVLSKKTLEAYFERKKQRILKKM